MTKFTTPKQARDHMFNRPEETSGVYTLTSRKTNQSFTYVVKRGKKRPLEHRNPPYFVGLLGSEGYQYVGLVPPLCDRMIRTAKSSFHTDSPEWAAFAHWLLVSRRQRWGALEVRETRRCGRCRRWLKDPVSIDLGYGPECAVKEGVAAPPKRRTRKTPPTPKCWAEKQLDTIPLAAWAAWDDARDGSPIVDGLGMGIDLPHADDY